MQVKVNGTNKKSQLDHCSNQIPQSMIGLEPVSFRTTHKRKRRSPQLSYAPVQKVYNVVTRFKLNFDYVEYNLLVVLAKVL